MLEKRILDFEVRSGVILDERRERQREREASRAEPEGPSSTFTEERNQARTASEGEAALRRRVAALARGANLGGSSAQAGAMSAAEVLNARAFNMTPHLQARVERWSGYELHRAMNIFDNTTRMIEDGNMPTPNEKELESFRQANAELRYYEEHVAPTREG